MRSASAHIFLFLIGFSFNGRIGIYMSRCILVRYGKETKGWNLLLFLPFTGLKPLVFQKFLSVLLLLFHKSAKYYKIKINGTRGGTKGTK